jgi:photosystem II stability/assembly factor-like uncharacterized protein
MNSLTALFSRINRIVFVLGIAFSAITLAGVIFVTASSNDGAVPATHFAAPPTDASTKAKIAGRFGELPLSFEINKGQTDPAVKFVSHGPGYDLFLTANEAVLSLSKPRSETTRRVEGSVLRLKLLGANAAPRVKGNEELPGKVNYFIGNDRNQWRRNISTYRKVRYTDVYPGIDIVYYGNQRELEYDFVVAPGANPKLIKFKVEGAERLRLDQQGNLLLALKHGEVRLNKPFIYQLADDDTRREVKGSYVISGNEISFKVRGADSGKPLVIDPVLSYSTFLGSNSFEQAVGIAVDAQGSAYVTGTTLSSAFPTTPGAFKSTASEGVFITKLDPTGSSLVYSTFLTSGSISGFSATFTTAIAVDSAGNAYVTGSTNSPDFPLANPLKMIGLFFKTTDAALHWNNTNTGLTEELNALAVAPTSSNTIYAGTFRGAYRSSDAGATWTKSSTSMPSVSALAVDPTNALVAYAGANGLFKTTDGGINWNALSSPLNDAVVRTIVFDPATPSTIYAGASVGLFRSTDNGSTWTGINTLGAPTDRDILSIAIDPTAPSTIYAGTLGHGLFKTTNSGASWTPINNGITSGFGTNPAVVDDVVIDPFNSATLYINVVGTINKSTNGGSSWATVNNSAVRGGINAMVADRSTPNTLYVGHLGHDLVSARQHDVYGCSQDLRRYEWRSKRKVPLQSLDFFPAIGTIIDDDPLDLLFEESGPTVSQVAALDAFLLVRDPFRVVLPDWFPTGGDDRNTRMMFFVRGLQLDPGEPPSAVVVTLTAGSTQFGVPVEDVRSVPGVDFAQVIVRLPGGLAAGDCAMSIRAHSRTTDVGKIRIAP